MLYRSQKEPTLNSNANELTVPKAENKAPGAPVIEVIDMFWENQIEVRVCQKS